MPVDLVDVEAAVRAYLKAVPGLTGVGNPVAAGVHLGPGVRSPSRGAIVEQSLPRRTPSDAVDSAGMEWRCKAVGSERAARRLAERAARALVRALDGIEAAGPVTVATDDGDVRLIQATDIAGPVFTGDLGGEVTYTVSGTVWAQPAP